MSLKKYEYLFNNQNRSHYLCLDIGGTKIASGIFQASKHLSLENLIIWQKSESKKGKENLLEAIKNLEQLYSNEKQHIFLTPIISIGTPGKLTGKYKTILAPGSAENLGRTPGEFDFKYTRLPQSNSTSSFKGFIHTMGLLNVQVVFKNSWKNIHFKPNHRVYWPRDRLGGGFCTYNKEKGTTFFSDGHIFDILLPDHKKEEIG